MTPSKTSNWLQVGSSIGIIVGLLLVALEMRQNSELVRMQLIQEDTNSYIAAEIAIAGENFAESFQKMLEEPENLTLAEMRAVESDFWGHTMYRWLGAYKLYAAGLAGSVVWQDMVDADAAFMFGCAYCRAWWDGLRTSGIAPQELVDYVDAAISDVPLNYTEEYFRIVQRNAENYRPE